MTPIPVPTAEQMVSSKEFDDVASMMRAFAKMHVKAAVNAIIDAAKVTVRYEGKADETSMLHVDKDFIAMIDQESIKEAYPLTNII